MFFACFYFVVLWVTVMGPKPARIKGNNLFYPFSCESKASAEVQHYLFLFLVFIIFLFLIAYIDTVIIRSKIYVA